MLLHITSSQINHTRAAQAEEEDGESSGGTLTALARVEFDFRAQAKYGDDLDVKISLDSFGRTSFTYGYEIVNAATGQLVSTAKTILVRFDYDAQKPAPLDDAFKAELSRPIS